MRTFLIAFITLMGFSSFSQISIQKPRYYYISMWQLKDLQEIPVGTKVLFQQNCTKDLPANVPTGVVFFKNVFHEQKGYLSMAIEFKDTVVVSVTYYLKANQQELLKVIGYPEIKARSSAIKGQWTYTLQEEKRRTTIVGDKKHIVVVQTI